MRPLFSISIVSHRQGALIADLASDLSKLPSSEVEVILTINTPEDESFVDYFSNHRLTVLRNLEEKGFGTNHNAAFRISKGKYFVVVNPDIRLQDPAIIYKLLKNFDNETVGAVGPLVTAPDGRVEDSARHYPTLFRVAKRRISASARIPDYPSHPEPTPVDWVAGMFIIFRQAAFRSCCGFDERFFMYLEDADICRRIWSSGYSVIWDSRFSVVHHARRASRRSPRHLAWHVSSLIRFLSYSSRAKSPKLSKLSRGEIKGESTAGEKS